MEEVVYDTSVLIELVKKGVKHIDGFTTILNLIEFPKAVELEGLGAIYPTVHDYNEALKLSVILLDRGTPIPAVDMVVAAVCINRGLTLITKDEHFKLLAEVWEDFSVRVEPSPR
ncbi:MAG: PIN domain-containing protein [Candidatus Bathyarchaeia archaeon]